MMLMLKPLRQKNCIEDGAEDCGIWNGFTWETEKKLWKNGSSKKTCGVTGLSTQIVDHKQSCILRQGKTPRINGKGDVRYCDQPLVDLDTIEDKTV